MYISERLGSFLTRCNNVGVNGAVILPGSNMKYLIDFSLEVFERVAMLLIGFRNNPTLVVPLLDVEKAREKASNICDIYGYSDMEGPSKIVRSLIGEEMHVIGIEGKMPFSLFTFLGKIAPKSRMTEVDHILAEMRILKNSEEINRHQKAAEILCESIIRTLSEIKPGMSERQVMFMFHKNAYDLDAESSYCLIQSGENSAKPHMEPTSRTIQPNDIIVFDAAITFKGYYSDVTRTVCIGNPTPNQTHIFQTVYNAQEKALDAIRQGLPAEEIDKIARSYITTAGFGDFFIHRTGHGLGLEVHEEPFIKQGYSRPLEVGMIFTVEPGIYLPNNFGVRLEDNIVITESGKLNTTKLPKTLSLKDMLQY